MNCLRYLTGGRLGDFFIMLSIVKENFLKTEKKGILYISNRGDSFRFPIKETIRDMQCILEKQDYIESFEEYNEQVYDIDLTCWRLVHHQNSKDRTSYLSPIYNIEWGKHDWITVPIDPKKGDWIILHFPVYAKVYYYDFNRLKWIYPNKKIVFASDKEEEYTTFKKNSNVEIPFYKCDSLLELCSIIHSSFLFVGTTSMTMTLADAKHCKRIIILQDNYGDNLYALEEKNDTTLRCVRPPETALKIGLDN